MNADEEMELVEAEFQHLDELDDHLKFYHANVSSHAAEMLIQQFKQNNQSKSRTISEFKESSYGILNYFDRHQVRNIFTKRRSL